METAAALSSVFQVWQSKAYHNEEMSKAFEFFSKEMEETKMAALREKERDQHSMISDRIQTLIVMQSLFFGAACAFVIEGELPSSTRPWVILLYSMFLAFSQVLLLISLVTSLKMQMKMSYFKMKKSKKLRKIEGQVNRHYKACKHLEERSLHLFFWGSVFLMTSSGILWYTRLIYTFSENLYSNFVYSVILGFGLLYYIWKSYTIYAMEQVENSKLDRQYERARRSREDIDEDSDNNPSSDEDDNRRRNHDNNIV